MDKCRLMCSVNVPYVYSVIKQICVCMCVFVLPSELEEGGGFTEKEKKKGKWRDKRERR